MRFLQALIVRWLWPEIERQMDASLVVELRGMPTPTVKLDAKKIAKVVAGTRP